MPWLALQYVNVLFPGHTRFLLYVSHMRAAKAHMSLRKRTVLSEPRLQSYLAEPRSAVGNMSGYRCVSDCRSRGREFDPGPVPHFRGD